MITFSKGVQESIRDMYPAPRIRYNVTKRRYMDKDGIQGIVTRLAISSIESTVNKIASKHFSGGE